MENLRPLITRNIVQILFLVVGGAALGLVVTEIGLRIYNPFVFRVAIDTIVLPTNREYTIHFPNAVKVDRYVTQTRNSLGFRGPEPVTDFENSLTIVTVGGSTTENLRLSDDKTWTYSLAAKLKHTFEGIWVNNAGISGHSTKGHQILLENYIVPMKPRVVLFLVGVNDVGKHGTFRGGAEPSPGQPSRKSLAASVIDAAKSLARRSETIITSVNLYRQFKASKRDLNLKELDLKRISTIEIDQSTRKRVLQQGRGQAAFEERLFALIRIARRNGIEPVLLTQPALYGDEVDTITGVDLGKISVGDLNGQVAWELLELYNDVTRNVGEKQRVFVVDLAREMEKDSAYFFDMVHHTNQGANRISEIVYKHLCPFLAEKYGQFQIQACPVLN